MTHLGRPVEEMREKLAKERHEEYNKYLKDVSTRKLRYLGLIQSHFIEYNTGSWD